MIDKAMTQLEIRCCCQPRKILGWINAPGVYHSGQMLALPLQRVSFMEETEFIDVLRLPVAIIRTGTEEHLALKAEGTPVETLRRCSGFIENKEVTHA